MMGPEALKDFKITLGAGERRRIARRGNFIRCTSANAAFTVAPGEGDTTAIPEGMGISYPEAFDSVLIENGATAQTITLYIGFGDLLDSRLYGAIKTEQTANPGSADIADVSLLAGASSVIAADADRVKITVYAAPTNAGYLRVGPGAGASRGYPLSAGGSFTFTMDDALTVYAVDAGAFGYIVEKSV